MASVESRKLAESVRPSKENLSVSSYMKVSDYHVWLAYNLHETGMLYIVQTTQRLLDD